ncbi:MAG: tRNA pseudouridine(55) synthase TruB [Spirochaetaceae bacterium]
MNSSQNPTASGIALIDKPEGVTSFQALSALKKKVGHGKVGHAGTLDKFASGLLIVLIGSYTKLNSYFTGLDKRYEGTLHFGTSTTTLDPEGEITDKKPVPEFDTVEASISRFIGTIDQVPPQFSAVHIEGKRAYQRALSGEDVKIPSRRVHIYSLETERWDPPELDFSVTCSKGTYIRALARDIGVYCNSSAYLSRLRRTHIGSFKVSDAVSPDAFDPQRHFLSDREALEGIPGLFLLTLKDAFLDRVKNGAHLQKEWLADSIPGEVSFPNGAGKYAAVLDSGGSLAAFVEIVDNRLLYKFVMPGEKR